LDRGAFQADVSGAAYAAMGEAYPGQTMHVSGFGGGIPLCNALARFYPEAEIL
jgi:hypothetical protein